MKSKRIGKDLRLLWRNIKTSGEFVSLNGRDLTLIMTDPKGGKTDMQMLSTSSYGTDVSTVGKVNWASNFTNDDVLGYMYKE